MKMSTKVAVIVLTGLSFICMHELGHWLAAESFSLQPGFVLGGANNGLLGMAVGVMHNPATPVQQTVVLFGATLLPVLIAVIAAGAAHFTGNETAALVAETYLLLIVINLIPIPNAGQLDSVKLLAAVLPP